MSESNGVIKIGRKGRTVVEFEGADGTVIGVVVDVVKVHDDWNELDWSFRDEKGMLLKDKQGDHRAASIEFLRELIRERAKSLLLDDAIDAAAIANDLSYAEVLHFHAEVAKQVQKLKPFFSVVTGDEPSPAVSSDVTYST